MSYSDKQNHSEKAYSYEHGFALVPQPARRIFTLPCDTFGCVNALRQYSTPETEWYFLEKNGDVFDRMIQKASDLKLNHESSCGDLHDYMPPKVPFDLMFFDLLGTVPIKLAQRISNFTPCITKNTTVVFTVQATGRNNPYISEVWRILNENYPQVVRDFCGDRNWKEYNVYRVALWLKIIFAEFDFGMSVYRYNDHPQKHSAAEMISIRMTDFERRQHDPYLLTHSKIESFISVSRRKTFERQHYGETKKQTKLRHTRLRKLDSATIKYTHIRSEAALKGWETRKENRKIFTIANIATRKTFTIVEAVAARAVIDVAYLNGEIGYHKKRGQKMRITKRTNGWSPSKRNA